jgi:hypothetical protein
MANGISWTSGTARFRKSGGQLTNLGLKHLRSKLNGFSPNHLNLIEMQIRWFRVHSTTGRKFHLLQTLEYNHNRMLTPRQFVTI